MASPWTPVAAAAGLVLLFASAVITHFRAHAEALSHAYPGMFLLLAVGSLVPATGLLVS